MSAQGDRLLAAIEAEIKNISKLEHTLARTKLVLQEQASRLRLGTNPELVMTSLRLSVPHETTLALIERVDPVLSPRSSAAPQEVRRQSGSSSRSAARRSLCCSYWLAGIEQPVDHGARIVRLGRRRRLLRR